MTPRRYVKLALYLSLASILLVAFAIRVWGLGQQAVWWDEAWSVWVAQQPFVTGTQIVASDVHPPLYQWLLWLWLVPFDGFSTSELIIRLPSVLFAIPTLAAVYAIGARLTRSSMVGLIPVVLLALSLSHVNWSQETRMYTQAAMFTALSVLAYTHIQSGKGRRLAVIGYVLAAVALVHTHYLGVAVVGIVGLHWLLCDFNVSKLKQLLLANLAVALLILPWFGYALTQIRSDDGVGAAFPLFSILKLQSSFLLFGRSTNVIGRYEWIIYAFMSLIALLLLWYTWQNRRVGLLLLLLFLLPPFTMFALTQPINPFYTPFVEERYFVIFLPLFFVAIALVIARAFALPWLRPVCMIIFAGIVTANAAGTFSYHDARYYRDDYAVLIAAAQALSQADDRLVLISGDRYPLAYYYADSDLESRTRLLVDNGYEEPGDQIRRAIGAASQFWLLEIEAQIGDPDKRLRDWVADNFQRVYTTSAAHNRISYYATTATATLPTTGQIVAPSATELRPGDQLRAGVPPGVTATITRGDTVLASRDSDAWQIAEFQIWPIYHVGDYHLNIGQTRFPFSVTHNNVIAEPNVEAVNTRIGPLELVGYALDRQTVAAGDRASLRVAWRLLAPVQENYAVFVHLLGPWNPDTNGPLWQTVDRDPLYTPLSIWWPGLERAESYDIAIPADMPPGSHTIQIGLYERQSGERVVNEFGDDTTILTELVVTP